MEATYDGSSNVSAGAQTGNEYASVGVEVSAKTGTVASADAGLDGNNVYVGGSYSDTTEAHLTVNGQVGYEGVGVGSSADAYVKSGNEAEFSIVAGQNGVAASASASCGTAAGVDAEATVGLREATVTAGAGVSVGEHFEVGGGGEATFKDGKATIGVSGEVAAVLGVEVDVSLTLDTHQIQKDSVVVAHETTKAANTVAHETTKAANNVVAKETTKAANTVAKESKKTANKIKKGLHL